MKIIIKMPSRLPTRHLVACFAIFVAFYTTNAHAYVYYSRDALLASFFPGSSVESVSYTPDRAALTATLGYALPRPTYEILVAGPAASSLGYAVLDSQLGQHEPVDFAVLIGPDGAVQRVEIMVYREAYGDGVRAPGFLRQFVGLGAGAPMRPGRDIQIVSGSTVSTRTLATGVRRAVVLVEAFRASSLGAP